MVKNYRNCIIATVIAVFFLGCSAEKGTSENSGTHSVSNPESRHIAMIETAPEKLQVSSLVAGASVSVEKNLVLESSYAAVSVWGEVNAPRTMTAGQNLDINSINRIQSDGAVFQAVDISSAEYKNAYILSENGIVIEFTNGNSRNVLTEEMPHAFQFINGQWMVSGEEVTIDKDVYVAGDLSVNAKSLKVSGIVAVQGDLNSEGDMDITVGSPFKYALIVNGNLKADSLSTLGRVNINGRVSVENDIIVTGSLESRDEIVCNGNMTIKSLDLSYMSAKQVATRELGENTLVSSQVFRDFSGRYSVAFFTYVKGHCDLDEEKLFDLIENNQTDSYEFCNVIVGASSSSLPELAWYNGISVYYLNKLKIRNSYTNAKVSDARSITNTTLYLSYTDEKGEAVGTFLVDGHSDDGEINEFGLVDLTKEAAGIQFEVDVSDDYKTYLDYKNSKWEKVAFPRLDTKTINLAYARKVMGLPSGTLLNHGFNVDALTSYNYSSIYSSLMVMKKLGIRTYNYQGVAGTVNRWYDENGWENRAIIFDSHIQNVAEEIRTAFRSTNTLTNKYFRENYFNDMVYYKVSEGLNKLSGVNTSFYDTNGGATTLQQLFTKFEGAIDANRPAMIIKNSYVHVLLGYDTRYNDYRIYYYDNLYNRYQWSIISSYGERWSIIDFSKRQRYISPEIAPLKSF